MQPVPSRSKRIASVKESSVNRSSTVARDVIAEKLQELPHLARMQQRAAAAKKVESTVIADTTESTKKKAVAALRLKTPSEVNSERSSVSKVSKPTTVSPLQSKQTTTRPSPPAKRVKEDNDSKDSKVLEILKSLKKYVKISSKDVAQCQSVTQLFQLLEEMGNSEMTLVFILLGELTFEVLELFANRQDIVRVSLSKTYAPQLLEIGLEGMPRHGLTNCTKSFFHGFSALRILDCSHVPLVDDHLRYLIHLSSLEALSLSFTRITNRGIRFLMNHAKWCSTLRIFKLAGIAAVDDNTIDLLNVLTELRELHLGDSTNVTLEGVRKLVNEESPLKRLEHLNLPNLIETKLMTLHESFANEYRLHRDVMALTKADQVSSLTQQQVVSALRVYKRHCENVYLNLDPQIMRKRLAELVTLRQLDERLWTLLL